MDRIIKGEVKILLEDYHKIIDISKRAEEAIEKSRELSKKLAQAADGLQFLLQDIHKKNDVNAIFNAFNSMDNGLTILFDPNDKDKAIKIKIMEVNDGEV